MATSVSVFGSSPGAVGPEFLWRWLQHGGGYEATSRALSVHRSTLKYRLQRIRELTGLELNDPDVHFNLQLATRAWGTLQALHDER